VTWLLIVTCLACGPDGTDKVEKFVMASQMACEVVQQRIEYRLPNHKAECKLQYNI